MRILLALLTVSLFSCTTNSNRDITGEYQGFWATTFWTINLKDKVNFEIRSVGHFGNTSTQGTYSINGDTLILSLDDSSSIAKWTDHEAFLINKDGCLIDVETRYDYCKVRPDEWRSIKRDIGYPQLPYDSSYKKSIVHQMVQKAIDQIEIKNESDSTMSMAEYYQITKSNGFRFYRLGKEIKLMSQEELKAKNITNYINIESLDLGQKSALIQLNIEPYHKTINSTISYFKKEKKNWVSDN